VENARHEIHERARQEAEQAIQQNEPAPNIPPITDHPDLPADRARDGNSNRRRTVLIILGIILLGTLIFGAVWLNNRSFRTGGSTEIPTATKQIISPTEPLQTEQIPMIVGTLSPTDTTRPSPTFKPTATRTQTRTPTPTPTSSQTPTMTVPAPTITRERPEKNSRLTGN
jgi:FtsZ-interacting cell division protein ZipA